MLDPYYWDRKECVMRSSGFSFTNTTAGSHDVTQVALGLTSNYAIMQDSADVVKLNNKTAPIDAEEIIAIRTRNIGGVATDATIQYPSNVKGGIEYSIRLDEVLSTTDSSDPTFRVDEPIICTVAFRHPKSGNITGAHIATVFQRLVSVLMKSDGTWRFDDLMRSSERPIVD
jgi:hypothetical protein